MHWMLLALAVLLAGTLRFADLEHRPPGFFCDEVEKGYNAWSMATTGSMVEVAFPATPGHPHVSWSRWPWMPDVLGVRTSALYQYASVPFMWAGGMTVASTRRAAALAGTLAVALAGLLFMRAWGAWPGLAVACWLALCHWHLVFSRWALQGIFVPLLMLVVLAGLWGWERRRRWGLPLAGGGLGWLFYAYSGAQPLVLAWGACLAAIYWRRLFSWRTLRSAEFWIGVAMFSAPVIPTVVVLLSPGGADRMNRIGVLNIPGMTLSDRFGLFYDNYFAHFRTWFLFVHGDANPRHGVPGMGQLTWADAVLLPAGVALALWKRAPLTGALLAALACGPIPAALTRDGVPHALRSIGMIVPAMAFSGYAIAFGAAWLGDRLRGSATSRAALARSRLLVGLLVVAVYGLAASGVARYWRLAGGDPLMQVAYSNGQRRAWERLAAEGRPGQRVWDDCYSFFSIYCQMFYNRVPPRSVGPSGPDPGKYVYYNPLTTSIAVVGFRMRPGDWILRPIEPTGLAGPDGEPPRDWLLYPSGPARAPRANGKPWADPSAVLGAKNVWVVLEQKPPAKSP
jgi:hypothetical protein